MTTNDIVFIGVDPGLTGGIAFIYPKNVYAIAMPLAGKEIDIEQIAAHIPNNEWRTIATVEKVGAMPGQGVVSMFKFGFVTGVIHGILRSHDLPIPINLVAPQTWKKVVLVDTDHSKEATADWCRRMYPQVNLLETPRCKKPHQGMVDALAIAHYGKITWKG